MDKPHEQSETGCCLGFNPDPWDEKEVNPEDKLFIKDRVRTFLTKVFEGPFKDAGRWAREMKDYVKSKGKESKKMNLYYTTCPSCAKVYDKSYTVILATV